MLLGNSAVNGVIVVGRVDKTTREEVRRARAILDRHVVAPIGLVVTGLRDAGRYGYEPYEAIDPTLQSDVGALARPSSRSPVT